jgi:hypothetical protein
MNRPRMARTVLFAAVALITSGCDVFGAEGSGRPARTGSDVPSGVAIWGCERAIDSKVDELDPHWRQESTVVGDLGFDLTPGDFSGFRRHERADIEVKLPVTIEGHAGATVWVPRHERDRVALILADVPRRGPGNSYRIEDGHQGVRFQPCRNRTWSGWTAGLALADRREIVLNVKVDGAPRPTRVSLGPWESFTIDHR